MKKSSIINLCLLLAGLLTFSALPATAGDDHAAAGVHIGDLTVRSVWARASVTANGAAYLSVHNGGAEDDALVAARSPAAGMADLHTHLMDDGVMRMRPIEDIPVPAGTTVTLEPGGLHIMLMHLEGPLTEGGTITLVLTFANAGEVSVEGPVLAAGAHGPAMSHEHAD